MYSAIGRSILIVPRRLSGFSSLRAAPNPRRYLFTAMGAVASIRLAMVGHSGRKGVLLLFFSLIKICYGSAGGFV